MTVLVGVEVLEPPSVAEVEPSPGVWLWGAFTVAVTDELGQVGTADVSMLFWPMPAGARSFPFTALVTDEVGQEATALLAITVQPEEE